MPTIADFIRPKEWISDFLVYPGYRVTGSYEDFKSVVKGSFKLKGDMARIIRNARFIRAVANSISSF